VIGKALIDQGADRFLGAAIGLGDRRIDAGTLVGLVGDFDGAAKITIDDLARGVAEAVQQGYICVKLGGGDFAAISDNSRLRTH
jgi:hypothetical protein